MEETKNLVAEKKVICTICDCVLCLKSLAKHKQNKHHLKKISILERAGMDTTDTTVLL